MEPAKLIGICLSAALFAGCASISPSDGPQGPEIVTGGYATESGSYAEVGVKFTTAGDFGALFSPSRWKNPVTTGGTLSWVNPVAWSDDAGRTGRILLGEAAVVGAAVVGFAIGSSGGGGTPDGGTSTSGPTTPPTPPPPPTGGGGPSGP